MELKDFLIANGNVSSPIRLSRLSRLNDFGAALEIDGVNPVDVLSGKKAITQEQLKVLKNCLRDGNEFDITRIDVSEIKNFSSLFCGKKKFNQDIGNWDVSNGNDFRYMFEGAELFNKNIGKWDVSNGENFTAMFSGCRKFNQDISNWNMSKGKYFTDMFSSASNFNKNIGKWNMENCENFSSMFSGCRKFNQDISNWNVSNGKHFDSMFMGCKDFNQDISAWDVSNGESFDFMLMNADDFSFSLANWNQSANATNINQFKSTKLKIEDLPKNAVINLADFNEWYSRAVDFDTIGDRKIRYIEKELQDCFVVDMEHLKLMQQEAGLIPNSFKYKGESAHIYHTPKGILLAGDRQMVCLNVEKSNELMNELEEAGLLEEYQSIPLNNLIGRRSFYRSKEEEKMNKDIENALNSLKAKEEKPVVESIKDNKRKSRSKYRP
ncbi:DUF285 domain-containing protein [Vibrio parahaemolyticus]|nr:DUF285 domain-containing protein [Vibrio parahaemolyticus]